MERWAETGEPTPKARLAEAAAFLDLGLADRAWIRLQELGPQNADAQLLTARMFLARGWRERARATLDALRPTLEASRRAELATLEAKLAEVPVDLPDVPPETEQRPEILLPLAERYLVTGSFLKAQVLLERLKKSNPDHRRVQDLLWALQGDFSGGNIPLASWVDRFGPDMPTITDTSLDEAENTESLGRSGRHLELDPDTAEAPFPSLFRNVAVPKPEGHDEEEVTQASRMTALPRIESTDDRGDTQISRVIVKQDGHADPTPLHQPHAPPEAFDLAAFRREMGMDGDFGQARSPSSDLEDEDDARVELHPDRAARPAAPAGEVPAAIRASVAAEVAQEQARPTARTAPAKPKAPPPPVDSEAPTPEVAPRRPAAARSLVPLWLLAAALALLFVAMMLFALLMLQMVVMSS